MICTQTQDELLTHTELLLLLVEQQQQQQRENVKHCITVVSEVLLLLLLLKQGRRVEQWWLLPQSKVTGLSPSSDRWLLWVCTLFRTGDLMCQFVEFQSQTNVCHYCSTCPSQAFIFIKYSPGLD